MTFDEMVRRIGGIESRLTKLEEALKYGQVQYPHGPVFAEIYGRLSDLEDTMGEMMPVLGPVMPVEDDIETQVLKFPEWGQ